MKLLTAAGGNMSLDSQVALLPYKSSSFATGGSVSLDFWAAVRPLQIQFAGVTLVSLEPGLRDLLYSYLQRHMAHCTVPIVPPSGGKVVPSGTKGGEPPTVANHRNTVLTYESKASGQAQLAAGS